MHLVMNELEIRHVQVSIKALDAELENLAIWTIPRPRILDFRLFPWIIHEPPTIVNSYYPYWPFTGIPIFLYRLAVRSLALLTIHSACAL